jgi:type III restriction enzyme
MKLVLLPFQETAAAKISGHLDTAKFGYQRTGERYAVGLTATTGAGKTVIATAVIEAILFGSDLLNVEPDPEAVFLWMTDMPELNRQTMNKMFDAGSDIQAETIHEIEPTFNEPSLRPGHVYFLNTQKLAAGAGLTKTGPAVKRTFTFYDVIRKTIEDDHRMLYLVVDEAHRGMTEDTKVKEANSIVQRFIKGYSDAALPAVPIVLGISATLDKYTKLVEQSGRTVSNYPVPVEDVRESGLIKDRTIAEYAGEAQTDEMALFPVAVGAWKEATADWAAYRTAHPDPDEFLVVPALIIQVENESADGRQITRTPLDAVIGAITDEVGALPDVAFVHAFGEKEPVPVGNRTIRYVEPSRIANDPNARVVFFKSSLGTGWDCPRAEVLFSFRRAVDATSIAQTIGRMVRTPLHRRIVEKETLNTAYVYLPHYDDRAVAAIVDKLNETGNEGAAGGLTRGRETVTLDRRADLERVTAAIQAMPSYIVGTPRARAEIRVLMDLASFLSSSGLDPAAYDRERKALTDRLVERNKKLYKKAVFRKEVTDQGDVVIHRAELLPGVTTVTRGKDRVLTASEETIARVFGQAKTRLTGDVAMAYVSERVTDGKVTLRTSRLEAYAMATRDEVMTALNQHASGQIDALRQTFGGRVDTLAASKQNRYKTIIRLAPTPTPTTVKLWDSAVFTRGDGAVPANHLYADGAGASPIKLNNLERKAIVADAGRQGVIGWLRCVERADWALCAKWRDGNIDRGFYPDFLVAREDGARVVVDIIDPHNHELADALGKAKGLSDYAEAHAEKVGHVDVLTEIDRRVRRLHLERADIRRQLGALNNNTELAGLYRREG